MYSLDPVVYRSPKRQLRLKEVPAAEAQLGMVLVRLVAWWSVARAVFGVGHVDRWRSSPSGGSTMLEQGR
jgi:hypothetical protein